MSWLDTPLVCPAARGGSIGLDTWRTRDWYPALGAAGIRQRGPYQLRHTFATEALAAGISIFGLARVMRTSVAMIDRTYGHLARDSEQAIRARLRAGDPRPPRRACRRDVIQSTTELRRTNDDRLGRSDRALEHECPDCGAAIDVRCTQQTHWSKFATEAYGQPRRVRHTKPHPERVLVAWRAHLSQERERTDDVLRT